MKISLLIILSALLLIGGPRKMQAQSQTPADSLKQVVAKMQKRLKALEQKQQEDELKKLRQEAQAFVRVSKKETKQKTFKSGQRSLQAINPEISMTGDAVGLAVLTKKVLTAGSAAARCSVWPVCTFRGISILSALPSWP